MKREVLHKLITDLRIDKSQMPFNAAAWLFVERLFCELTDEARALDWNVEEPADWRQQMEKILSIEEGE
jgi:type II restriction/modification system DNA methylase subunit YeeA